MGKNVRRVAVWAALGSLLAIPWMETVGISQIGVPKPGDTQGDCIYGCKQGESFYIDLDGTAYETEQPVCIEMFKFQNGTPGCPKLDDNDYPKCADYRTNSRRMVDKGPCCGNVNWNIRGQVFSPSSGIGDYEDHLEPRTCTVGP